MPRVKRISPIDRLNVEANTDRPDPTCPNRLQLTPRYRCPACETITAFGRSNGLLFQHPLGPETTRLFDKVTEPRSVFADFSCSHCGRPVRVVCDIEEPNPGAFRFTALYVLELEDPSVPESEGMADRDRNGSQGQIIDLMKVFLSGQDCSIGLANRIEDALLAAFPDDKDANDLVVALACYRPEGGPDLYDVTEMKAMLSRYFPLLERLASA